MQNLKHNLKIHHVIMVILDMTVINTKVHRSIRKICTKVGLNYQTKTRSKSKSQHKARKRQNTK